jgi:hypothetical protein
MDRAIDGTVKRAERIISGKIELFPNYTVHVQSGGVPWHEGQTVSGDRREWPRVYCFDIDVFRSGIDPKFTRELNRCQYLQVLGRAYRYTEDERFASEAARHIRDWIDQNPFEIGINWQSILNVAIRTLSWASTGDLCAPSSAWSDHGMETAFAGSLWQHGEHLYRYLEWHPNPDTHTLGEALALIVLGLGFRREGKARRWLAKGLRVVEKCAVRQFTAEGLYYERNLQYHAYELDFLANAVALVQRHSLNTRVDLEGCLRRVVEATIALCDTNGELPEIGDDDGGKGSALDSRRHGRDTKSVLALAAALLGTPITVRFGDHDWELAYWLLDGEAERRRRELSTTPNGPAPSVFMPDAGYAVQRSDGSTLWMRCGMLGLAPHAGHGHADLLHVVLHTERGPQLVDSGTFTYNGDQEDRRYFRSTQAHNTIVVDDMAQAKTRTRFSWERIPRCDDLVWHSDEKFDWISAQHQSYGIITHWRGVLSLKSFCWLIFDQITGPGSHHISSFFHFPPGADVEHTGESTVTIPGSLVLEGLCVPESLNRCGDGTWRVEQGWVATGYGSRTRAPMARREWHGELPLRAITAVSTKGPVDIRQVHERSGEPPRWILKEEPITGQIVWHSGPDLIKINGVELQSGIVAHTCRDETVFVYHSSPQMRAEECA